MYAVAFALCAVALAGSAMRLAVAARRWRAVDRLAADAERLLETTFGTAMGSGGGNPHVRLARAVAEMARRHRELRAELAATGSVLDAAGRTLRQTAATEKRLADRQAERVAGIGANAEELARAASTAEVHAKGVVDRSAETDVSAERGLGAVSETEAAVVQLRVDVEAMGRTVQALARRGAEVDEIVAAVNEIAERTHVLSLNASLEAARGGEHGRGFAVVAAEMRALAERSRAETDRARAILSGFHAQGAEAAERAVHGEARAAAVVELAGRARAAIETLAGAVAESSRAAHDIAATSRAQAEAVALILEALAEARGESAKRSQTATGTLDALADGVERAAERTRRLAGARDETARGAARTNRAGG